MSRAESPTDLVAARAAHWVVRMASDAAGPDNYDAFVAWLTSDPTARAAYDAALAVWLLSAQAEPGTVSRIAQADGRRVGPIWIVAAAVLTLGLSFGVKAILASSAHEQVLETRPGQRRAFTLADGSRVTLAGDSYVAVRLGAARRSAVMGRGDAAFNIADQTLRSFQVIAGDDALNVVGAQFGLRRRDGRLRVVVRRGVVAVGPKAGTVGPHVRLPAGSELNHVEGTTSFQVSEVDPETAFDW